MVTKKLIDKWNWKNFYLYDGDKTIDIIKEGSLFKDIDWNIINVEWAIFIPYEGTIC